VRLLRAASAKIQGGGLGTGSNRAWQINGGVAQMFRYDNTRYNSGTSTPGAPDLANSRQTTRQNALYNDIDALVRHRGENVDLMMRLSAGYTKQFATDAFGDYKRVSLA
jgi:hypothetical protein